METKNFRSVAFGGFDKEEVINYIQQMAQENSTEQERLQREASDLHAASDAMKAEAERLRRELERAAKAESASLQEEVARLQEENAKLSAKVEQLRPQAEAYQKVKDQVGDIECQARKRACELESSTTAQLNTMVGGLQRLYRELSAAFNVTADQVTSELRKVEVNLSQLPRALDQAGTMLDELEAALPNVKKD